MRVPPGTKNAQPKVLVTGIQPSEKGNLPIDDYQFSVIAKVDLKLPAKLAIRDEGLNGHARIAQFLKVGAGSPFDPTLS